MSYCWDHPTSSSCCDSVTMTYYRREVLYDTYGPLRKKTLVKRHRSFGKSVELSKIFH